jgi:hypothetical protein
MRSAGRFRQMVSALVALGLLLVSATSVPALPTVQPNEAMSVQAMSVQAMSAQAMMPSTAGDHCTDPCCMDDPAADAACSLCTVCTLAPLVPVAHAMIRAIPMPVRYWARSDGCAGLTQKPDLGPPIARG